MDERTNRVLVVNGNFAGQGSVSVLDARSGDLLRTVAVQDSPWAIAVDEHTARAFVANGAAASVSVLDARSGRLLRTVAVGQRPVAITVDELTQHAFVVNSGPYPYADTTGTVSVLDTRTGAVVTAVVVGQEPSAVAVDSRHGRVAVTNTGSDSVSLLDARSGDLLHTVMVGLAPMIVGADAWRGHAFIVNEDDGTMSVLDTQNGTVLHTVRVDRRMAGSPLPPYAIALDEAHNRVYVSTWGRLDRAGMPRGNGMLHVFDARNGAPIQTIAVGVSPVAMAVDQRMEQVFIVFADGLAPRRRPWWAPVTQPLRRWLPWLPSQASSSQRMPGSVSILDNRRI